MEVQQDIPQTILVGPPRARSHPERYDDLPSSNQHSGRVLLLLPELSLRLLRSAAREQLGLYLHVLVHLLLRELDRTLVRHLRVLRMCVVHVVALALRSRRYAPFVSEGQ